MTKFKILFAITGSGYLIKESIDLMKELQEDPNIDITVILSKEGAVVVKWYRQWLYLNEIVIFQGIPQKEIIDDYPVYYAAEKNLVERLESFNIKKVEKGIIVGPEATILNEALSNRLQAFALFTPVLEIPTPEAGVAIIEVLNKIYDLTIDTSKLIEEGKIIKKKMLELAEKAQQYQQQQLPDTPRKEYTQYYQ